MTILILYLISGLAIADDFLASNFPLSKGNNCSEVRLDLPPEVMSKIPIQDQKDLKICWSHATTQILDAWKIKNDPPLKFSTSPYTLALQYKASKNKSNLIDQEKAHELLSKINEFKSCSQKTFNDKMTNGHIQKFITELDSAQKNQFSETQVKSEINACLQRAGFKNELEIRELSNHLKDENKIKNINNVLQELCKKEAIQNSGYPKPKLIVAPGNGDAFTAIRNMRNLIDKRLNNKSTPPIITFCYSMLKDKNLITMQRNGLIDTNKCPTVIHNSPIVARRPAIYINPDNGEKTVFCQYLVRDSFGTSCANYPDDKDMLPSNTCDKGQVWVDETSLFLNTNDVVYIEDKEEQL